MHPLPRSFYERSSLLVARDLLGCRLVRLFDGQRLSGLIAETEAYQGEDDLACHARAGRTPRTAVMYGPAGHTYVYFTYGVHWMLNIVAEKEGYPAAVLLRSIFPREGLEVMARLRSNLAHTPHWTDGPAKLVQALAIDGAMNGLDLCASDSLLFIEPAEAPVSDEQVTTGPRIGLFNVPEPWKSVQWNYKMLNDES